MIAAIVKELAPALIARPSIGLASAAQLLLTAGDNPERLKSEASFAALCDVSPVPASSGKTVRHRLNRGGDRAANSALHIIAIGRLRLDPRTQDYVARRTAAGALHIIAIGRLRLDPRTQDYVARRTAAGHSRLEAIRCLKRYIAREVFNIIVRRQKEINQSRIAA